MTTKDPLYTGQIVLSTVGDVPLIKLSDGTTIVDKDGNVDAPITTTDLTTSGTTTLGDSSADPTTVSGNLTVGGITVNSQTPQTLSGAGAVDVTSAITLLVTTAADALTLADGAEGQQKVIVMKTDGGDGTLTPSNLSNGTTITFDDVGDSANLIFTDGSWNMIGGTATLA